MRRSQRRAESVNSDPTLGIPEGPRHWQTTEKFSIFTIRLLKTCNPAERIACLISRVREKERMSSLSLSLEKVHYFSEGQVLRSLMEIRNLEEKIMAIYTQIIGNQFDSELHR